MQLSLFDATPSLPDGFRYERDFLSTAEETALLRTFTGLDFQNFRWHEYTGKRRTVTFGWNYSFDRGDITAGAELPDFLQPYRERAERWAGLRPQSLVQGMVTEYGPGAPIGWHRDAPPFGAVIGMSLGSDCRFLLRLERENVKRELCAERRSIYALTGPARTVWQHSIPPVKETRYSITFRTLR